jgi:hypothetical protein
MSQLSLNLPFVLRVQVLSLLSVVVGSLGLASFAALAQGAAQAPAASMSDGKMAHMPGHMYMTTLKPLKAGDQQKADAVVAAAKTAMSPYQDYRKALADGYEIFFPDVPQPQYHFTKYEYGREAWSHFDPLKPTSLLYKKTADGGYKLVERCTPIGLTRVRMR